MSQVSDDNFLEDISSKEIKGKKYALVVGVNKPDKVRSLPALRYAESDATGIGYLLGRKECNFAFPSGLLIGEAASTQNVRKAITYLIDGKSTNDLLLFYFIGHGYPAEISEGKFEVYLVTSDFDPDQARLNPKMYLSLDEIRKMLYEHQNTASVICILDCCDAGYLTGSPPPEKQLGQSLETFATNIWEAEQSSSSSHRTWAVLASTEQGTATYEHINDRSEGHALMTGLILDALSGNAREALNGDKNLTLGTLHEYLQTRMERQGSGKQHPIMQGTFHQPLILAHHPSENRVPRSLEDYPQSPLRQPFDVAISPATFEDLDLEQVRMFLKKERVQLQRDYRANSSEQAQMQALGLLQGEHPSYAALLCFGDSPSRQIAGAYTRCIYWSDPRHLNGWMDERKYRGSLLEQFTQACDFLRNHLRFSRVIERDGSSERPEIPFRVLEEVVANALVHREYVTGPDHAVRTEGVRVEIFSDRVEISNPGGPPVPLDRKHLESHPRNSQIMRIVYLAGYTESLGTGIKRIQRLMQEAGLPQPDIRASEQTFTISLFRPSHLLPAPLKVEQLASRMPVQVLPELASIQSEKVVAQASPKADRTAQIQVPVPFAPSQPAPNQSHPRKKNKRLVLPVPKFSLRSPTWVALYVLLIVGVVLGLVTGTSLIHAPASTTIEIASDFPTSGLDTTDGLPMQNGVQMAITEANHEHLLPGYTFKLVPYNDVGNGNRHDPQVGAKNLERAIADNLVAGMIGPYNSTVALKELPLANQAPLALLSPSTTFPCLTKSTTVDSNCTETNDVATQMRPASPLTFFRLPTTDDQQGKAAADYFFQTKRYSKVLLLKDDSDPYSFGLAQAFWNEWDDLGGQTLSLDLPENVNSMKDYQNTLQAVVGSFQPELIYFAGVDPSGSDVLQALSNIPVLKAVPFAGEGGIMDSSLLQTATNLHRDAPIYVSLPLKDPAHSGTTTGTNFKVNYKVNGYNDYRPYAAAAYDCTMILIQAIKTSLQKGISTPHETQDHAGAVQFRRAVLQALRHLSYMGATGMHSFDANGDTTNHTISFYQADLSTSPPNWTWLQQVKA